MVSLASILPQGVVVFETSFDVGLDVLTELEMAYIAGAVRERQREFSTVRWCARQAMSRLGVVYADLVPGSDRAPLWPGGVIGSMTHCNSYRAAAVARRGSICSLGIDAEPNQLVPSDVLEMVALPEERLMFEKLNAMEDRVAWDRLVFSAKESVFKALYPIFGLWIDFLDCRIEIHLSACRFTVEFCGSSLPLMELATERIVGRWAAGRSPDSNVSISDRSPHLFTSVMFH